jgi:hypothetical protein
MGYLIPGALISLVWVVISPAALFGFPGSLYTKALGVFFFSWPIVVIATFVLLQVKKTPLVVALPSIALVLVLAVIALQIAVTQSKIRHASRAEDQTAVVYDLDGIAMVSVPQSFRQSTRIYDPYSYYAGTILGPHYDLNLKDGWILYSFSRDAYDDISSTKVPVLLGIRFYSQNTPMPPLNADYFDQIALELISFTSIEPNLLGGHLPNPNPGGFEKMGVLVYTDPESKARVYMTYWDTYLTDEAANTLFKAVIQSIDVKNSLDSKIEGFKQDLYREAPDEIIELQ